MMTDIVGRLRLDEVMAHLAHRRPVFHSEADFQFAFAQAVVALDDTIEVRLEARQTIERAEYVDLACWTQEQRTLMEFKYATARWEGTDHNDEEYILRNHAAHDLARRYFIHDIHRLERFTSAQANTDGIAIMLTNEPGLWNDTGRTGARDADFRIHEGRVLTGHLQWGTGDAPKYDQHLEGTYAFNWRDYFDLDGPKGRFRWVAVTISMP
jgi:hypothetical protein